MSEIDSTKVDMFGSFNPKHHVVGVVDGDSEVESARQALTAAGVSTDDVSTYSADEVTRGMAEHEENKGFFGKLAGLFPSQEDDLVKSYRSEAEIGACFVFVYAADKDARDRVANALRSVGTRQLRYYADMTIVDLSKDQGEQLMRAQG